MLGQALAESVLKALLWIESLRGTEFIGTESRLASIFAGLDEILRYASDDVDERISLLTADAYAVGHLRESVSSLGHAHLVPFREQEHAL
jgi:hypothetical protein